MQWFFSVERLDIGSVADGAGRDDARESPLVDELAQSFVARSWETAVPGRHGLEA
jgi:hypothetical protein